MADAATINILILENEAVKNHMPLKKVKRCTLVLIVVNVAIATNWH